VVAIQFGKDFSQIYPEHSRRVIDDKFLLVSFRAHREESFSIFRTNVGLKSETLPVPEVCIFLALAMLELNDELF